MHLLYVDESGSIADSTQKYFVLTGVSVFERQTHWIEQKLNTIAERFAPGNPHAVELHGAPMRGGSGLWRTFPVVDRTTAIIDSLQSGIADQKNFGVNLFSVVIDKSKLLGVDPVEHAFEQLTSQFDLFLKRLHQKHRNSQRGLMIFDKSSTEQRLQTLAREFKYSGHSLGKTANYAEVPVFLDSRASRLIQLADLAAYAVFRHFERNDSQFFNVIQHCFDSEGGVQHGLCLKP